MTRALALIAATCGVFLAGCGTTVPLAVAPETHTTAPAKAVARHVAPPPQPQPASTTTPEPNCGAWSYPGTYDPTANNGFGGCTYRVATGAQITAPPNTILYQFIDSGIYAGCGYVWWSDGTSSMVPPCSYPTSDPNAYQAPTQPYSTQDPQQP